MRGAAGERSRRGGWPGVLVALALLVASPRLARAQVSGLVELRDGHGRALVRNPGGRPARVEVALWESDEWNGRVELTRRADGNVWPTTFDLPAGETQVVRLSVSAGAYPAGRLLRLETRLVPLAPDSGAAARGPEVRLVVASRILSKVQVR